MFPVERCWRVPRILGRGLTELKLWSLSHVLSVETNPCWIVSGGVGTDHAPVGCPKFGDLIGTAVRDPNVRAIVGKPPWF